MSTRDIWGCCDSLVCVSADRVARDPRGPAQERGCRVEGLYVSDLDRSCPQLPSVVSCLQSLFVPSAAGSPGMFLKEGIQGSWSQGSPPAQPGLGPDSSGLHSAQPGLFFYMMFCRVGKRSWP